MQIRIRHMRKEDEGIIRKVWEGGLDEMVPNLLWMLFNSTYLSYYRGASLVLAFVLYFVLPNHPYAPLITIVGAFGLEMVVYGVLYVVIHIMVKKATVKQGSFYNAYGPGGQHPLYARALVAEMGEGEDWEYAGHGFLVRGNREEVALAQEVQDGAAFPMEVLVDKERPDFSLTRVSVSPKFRRKGVYRALYCASVLLIQSELGGGDRLWSMSGTPAMIVFFERMKSWMESKAKELHEEMSEADVLGLSNKAPIRTILRDSFLGGEVTALPSGYRLLADFDVKPKSWYEFSSKSHVFFSPLPLLRKALGITAPPTTKPFPARPEGDRRKPHPEWAALDGTVIPHQTPKPLLR